MANTDYPGIDYGMGQANVDRENGIHYGVISLNSLNEFAVEEFEADYGPATCPECGNEATEGFDDDRDDYEDWTDHGSDYSCEHCKYSFNTEEAYGDDPISYVLDTTEYRASLDQYNDVFLVKSPYYTRAQYCSPCAPGAGHLDHPCDAGPKTYCFGHEWFNGGKAPYPVYRVSDDTLVTQ